MIIPLIPQIKISRKDVARAKQKKEDIKPSDSAMIEEVLYKVSPIPGCGEMTMEDYLLLRKMLEEDIY